MKAKARGYRIGEGLLTIAGVKLVEKLKFGLSRGEEIDSTNVSSSLSTLLPSLRTEASKPALG